jgi:hypothetical protein
LGGPYLSHVCILHNYGDIFVMLRRTHQPMSWGKRGYMILRNKAHTLDLEMQNPGVTHCRQPHETPAQS